MKNVLIALVTLGIAAAIAPVTQAHDEDWHHYSHHHHHHYTHDENHGHSR